MFELFFGLTISMFLLLWFKTDAFVEYVRLFGIEKWFRVDEYFIYQERIEKYLSYPEYLEEMYGYHFLIRLITCEICLSVWLGFLSLRWSCLVCSFIGLCGYLILVKLLDHGRFNANSRDRSLSSRMD